MTPHTFFAVAYRRDAARPWAFAYVEAEPHRYTSVPRLFSRREDAERWVGQFVATAPVGPPPAARVVEVVIAPPEE